VLFVFCLNVNVHWCLTVRVCIGTKVPGKPGCPVVSAVSGRQVTMNWTPPDSDGGSPIIQYIIYYDDTDNGMESLLTPKIAGRSRSCTFSKILKFNSMCKFAVAAKSKSGIGPLSEFTECCKAATRGGKNIIVRHFCPDIIMSFVCMKCIQKSVSLAIHMNIMSVE